MNRRQCLRLALGAAAFAGASQRPTSQAATLRPSALEWRERVLHGFGTTLWLRAAHADAARADAGLDDALAAVRRVEAQMSLFDPDSALCRLNRDGVLDDPPAELLAVLRLARQVARRSGGSFDVTVQPLWQAWESARRRGELPDPQTLRRARAQVGWQGLELTPSRVRLARAGMGVTLNGIAQGYAADLAAARLRDRGIVHALLDTGEWAPLGRGPQGEPWTLGLADPRHAAAVLARLQSDGRALATSSDAHSAFSADLRHHHILDPRTGDSPPALASVTVAAPSCALADALTKVMFMAGPQAAPRLARHWGVDVLTVDKSGRVQASAGLKAAIGG